MTISKYLFLLLSMANNSWLKCGLACGPSQLSLASAIYNLQWERSQYGVGLIWYWNSVTSPACMFVWEREFLFECQNVSTIVHLTGFNIKLLDCRGFLLSNKKGKGENWFLMWKSYLRQLKAFLHSLQQPKKQCFDL